MLPDAGKRTTPDMTAAFTRTIHDCESAARKKHYCGYNEKGFHCPWPARAKRFDLSVLYERTLNRHDLFQRRKDFRGFYLIVKY